MTTNISSLPTVHITLSSSCIEVLGFGRFCAAIAIALDEIPKWEFINDDNGMRLVSKDDMSSMTIFLTSTTSAPVEGDIACVLQIAGGYYSPLASYLYESNGKKELINFI